MGWRIRAIGINRLQGIENSNNLLVTCIWFATDIHFQLYLRIGIPAHDIRTWTPKQIVIINHTSWYILMDNTKHNLVDKLLLFTSMWHISIVRLEFITQVPMGKQCHRFMPEGFALFIAQTMHHNIITSNIVLCLAKCLRIGCHNTTWHTGMKHITQTRICPLLTCPIST